MNGHNSDRAAGIHEVPFYSRIGVPEVTDEEVLTLYAIYRNVSHGRTLEPYESMLNKQHAHERGDYSADR